MRCRTRTAKVLYWLSGKTSRIQTWQDTFSVESWEPLTMVPAGRIKLPCSLSLKLLDWSMDLDWDHWDHWACDYTGRDTRPCPDCGGLIDPALPHHG